MSTTSITSTQRVKLITLWHQYSRRSLDVGLSDRAERLQWASALTRRTITSFNDLTALEASRAISTLNKSMGLPAHQKRGNGRPRPGVDRDSAQAAGTHGRRGDDRRSAELAGPEDLARVERAIARLGWTRQRFDAWLVSPSSPLNKHSKPVLRTVADCNRVWWALKQFLKREGKWEE